MEIINLYVEFELNGCIKLLPVGSYSNVYNIDINIVLNHLRNMVSDINGFTNNLTNTEIINFCNLSEDEQEQFFMDSGMPIILNLETFKFLICYNTVNHPLDESYEYDLCSFVKFLQTNSQRTILSGRYLPPNLQRNIYEFLHEYGRQRKKKTFKNLKP
jgi:hypothetical protein